MTTNTTLGLHADRLLETLRRLILENEALRAAETEPHAARVLELNIADLRTTLTAYEALFAEWRTPYLKRGLDTTTVVL